MLASSAANPTLHARPATGRQFGLIAAEILLRLKDGGPRSRLKRELNRLITPIIDRARGE